MGLILASASPRRQELLKMITADFTVAAADIDESVPLGMTPEAYVTLMAARKAQVVSQKHRGELVIGSDTIVSYDGKILGKPKNRQEAREMLQGLSGRTHTVYTAVCLTDGHRTVEELVSAEVSFFELTAEEIDVYLETGEYEDKAGAYGIQGQGALLVKSIKGDYYAIVGFPVAYVARLLVTFTKK